MKRTVSCDHCGKDFEKAIKRINYSIKEGRKTYCSRSCAGKGNINDRPLVYNSYDEYTPFRYHHRNINKRGKIVDLSLQDIKDLWESQGGKCAYLKIELKLDTHKSRCMDPIRSASLDRIDSSMGYVNGNVQFVSRSINLMKGSMSHEETIELIKLIKESI